MKRICFAALLLVTAVCQLPAQEAAKTAEDGKKQEYSCHRLNTQKALTRKGWVLFASLGAPVLLICFQQSGEKENC